MHLAGGTGGVNPVVSALPGGETSVMEQQVVRGSTTFSDVQ